VDRQKRQQHIDSKYRYQSSTSEIGKKTRNDFTPKPGSSEKKEGNEFFIGCNKNFREDEEMEAKFKNQQTSQSHVLTSSLPDPSKQIKKTNSTVAQTEAKQVTQTMTQPPVFMREDSTKKNVGSSNEKTTEVI